MPVTVQHDITDNKHACLLKGGNMYLHNRQYWFNPINKDILATESTEEHGNITYKAFILLCSSVDSVAI